MINIQNCDILAIDQEKQVTEHEIVFDGVDSRLSRLFEVAGVLCKACKLNAPCNSLIEQDFAEHKLRIETHLGIEV